MRLRDYQENAVKMLWDWIRKNPGDPILCLPTGSGKSVIAAAICKDVVDKWNGKVCVLSHVKEILEQNATAIWNYWTEADVGIYSASIGRKEEGHSITIAGVASVYAKPEVFGDLNIVLIDECHRVSTDEQTMYGKLLTALKEKNPGLRVVGLTATPYRLGQGLLTEGKNAIFSDILEPITIEELIDRGHLTTLRSKLTDFTLDLSQINLVAGEYNEKELQHLVSSPMDAEKTVKEIILRGKTRRSWLIFCAGVEHAKQITALLETHDIPADFVVGDTPQDLRANILHAFKNGEIRALCNANVLTTGFDAPNIDLIAMLRPTMSPGLYVQMAGRGLRNYPGKQNCLVLDFAGNIERHGPITDVRPVKTREQSKINLTKKCPDCMEIVSIGSKVCPSCGYAFTVDEKEKKDLCLSMAYDIMKDGERLEATTGWAWEKHTSKNSGKEMLKVSYLKSNSDDSVVIFGKCYDGFQSEYFPLTHTGWARENAIKKLSEISHDAGMQVSMLTISTTSLDDLVSIFNDIPAPIAIVTEKDEKDSRYRRVKSRLFLPQPEHIEEENEEDSDDILPF